MKNKISLLLLMFLLVLPMVFATENFGTFKQNSNINLIQTYNATYCNITSITAPDSTLLISGELMTKSGSKFNYTLLASNTSQLGTYAVCGECDTTSWCANFEITPTGETTNGWKITIQIFVSVSALFLMILFLYLSFAGINSGMAKKENNIIRFFFIGLALIFLIAHIIITSIIIHNTLGIGSISYSYNAIMYVFFTIIILFFLYTLVKITLWEVDVFMKAKGLR
jgi:hypothetical protein